MSFCASLFLNWEPSRHLQLYGGLGRIEKATNWQSLLCALLDGGILGAIIATTLTERSLSSDSFLSLTRVALTVQRCRPTITDTAGNLKQNMYRSNLFDCFQHVEIRPKLSAMMRLSTWLIVTTSHPHEKKGKLWKINKKYVNACNRRRLIEECIEFQNWKMSLSVDISPESTNWPKVDGWTPGWYRLTIKPQPAANSTCRLAQRYDNIFSHTH